MRYRNFVEQLTYLLFLKMVAERSRPPYSQPSLVHADYAWPRLLALDGDALNDHYRHALEALGNEKSTLGLIFGKARNKFQDPAKLRRVIVDLIDAENWSPTGADVKGDAYGGPLDRNAGHPVRHRLALHAARFSATRWTTSHPRSPEDVRESSLE